MQISFSPPNKYVIYNTVKYVVFEKLRDSFFYSEKCKSFLNFILNYYKKLNKISCLRKEKKF